MPYELLPYQPGYYTDGSRIDSYNRYIDGNHVRFFKGFAKKIGGSVKATVSTFLGLCRFLTPWVTLADKKYVAIGTNLKLYINYGGTLYDITPLRLTVDTVANDPFTTVISTTTVTVTDVANGALVNDFVTFSGATAVGGLTIVGNYQITSIIDADNYTITAASAASSSATGGGAAVKAEYEIHAGSPDSVANIGWGAGTWGTGTWGTPRSSAGVLQFARTWSGNNYGEDLVVSPRGDAIYVWVAADGLATRAVVISEAPATNEFVLVSSQDRYIIALGAYDDINSTDDPMLVRWSSQNDYTDWTASTINTAGSNRLSDGNLIMCGVITRGSVIISTDTTVYQMYPDTNFVFAFKTLGVGGCISPNGMVEFNGIVYWMGADNFYAYNGNINIMPCDVRTYVFENLNTLQNYKIYAWVNSAWNEIWWFYADQNSTECNRYVAYDYLQNVWHYGSRSMTAGHDKGVVTSSPISAGSNGYQYYLESGVDEDGAAMDTLITTGATQVQTHNRFAYVRKILPNFIQLVGTTTMELITRLYPQDGAPVTSSTYTIDDTTTYVSTRMRGDEFAVQYRNSELGSDFWIGTPEVEVVSTGSR